MHQTRILPGRSTGVLALIGAALIAAIDEIVFHQILSWHHFYDRSTTELGLVSDGLLHTAEVVGLAAGLVLYADLRRRNALSVPHAWAGLFLGLGGFQLFDGLVNHKVLRVHQVRYGVDTLPYDFVWSGVGVALSAVGVGLAVRAKRART